MISLNLVVVIFACVLLQCSLGALNKAEKAVLVDFYNSLTSKGTLRWNVNSELCGQTGITCDGPSTSQKVIELDLFAKQLSGTIPTQFGSLTNLQYLYLDSNQLSGTIPTQFGSLTNLQELYLTYNKLSGTIPTQLGSLTNLEYLDLFANQLSGTIPTQFGSLTNLMDLILRSNQLSGTIPTQLESLTNLQYLDLSLNQLSGTIPTQLGSLTNLEYLYLTYNKLSGTIPTQLGSLTNLEYLYLTYNQLNGTIPTQLESLTNLEYLDLDSNQLSGTIPTQLGSLTNLMDLDINDNQLSGTIPTQLGSLTNLQYLSLYDNQLSGTIPTQLGSLTNLEYLYLDSNQLSGTIPTQLESLTNLQYILLSSNYWDCPVFDYSSFALFVSDYPVSNSECVLICPEDPNQCQNGGQCSTRLSGDYHCECLDGFTGANCENVFDIDECKEGSYDCQAQAICENTIGSYLCFCPPGSGLYCVGTIYRVNITTATSNGADTKSNIYIKFNGTDGESELLLFSQGVRKGQNVVQNYELESVGDIGTLTQVYLELDPPTDQWRYSTFSIIDIYGSEYIFGTKVLNSNIPFLWFDTPSTYEVSITTATTNGAGTTGTVSIKFKGTDGESKLYSFRKGFTKGWVNTKTFKFPRIGNLTQVYLELDTPEDPWRFSTISIKYNDHTLYTFNKSYGLNQNLPSVWLKSPEITYL